MAFKFHAARQVSGAQWTVNRWNAFNCAISVIILWFCACQSEKWTDGWHVSRLTRWQRDGASGYRQPSNGPTDSNQLIDQWQPKSRPSNSALDKRNKLWLQHLSSRRLIFYFQKNLLIWIFSIKCDASAIISGQRVTGSMKEKSHARDVLWTEMDFDAFRRWNQHPLSVSLPARRRKNSIRFRRQVQATWSDSIAFNKKARVSERIGRFSKLITCS